MAPSVKLAKTIPNGVDAVGLAVTSDEDLDELSLAIDGAYARRMGFEAKLGQVQVLPDSQGRSVILVGMGPARTFSAPDHRKAAALMARSAGAVGHLAIDVGRVLDDSTDLETSTSAAVEGALLGSYKDSRFRSTTPKPGLTDVTVLASSASKAVKEAVSRGEVIATATNLARDLVNEPGGSLTAPELGKRVAKLARRVGLACEIWDLKQIRSEQMGGLLGVNRGSELPPVFIKLSHSPKRAKAHVVLVGKGITFDSGGLSIKTGSGMMAMKTDMAGGAAVIAAMSALPALGADVAVTAFIPATDNMLGGDATRPGDVLTIRGGRTVEVLNTDAEGRLVLADALDLACELEPDAIIDLATLTGASMVALGPRIAGVMGNDEELQDRFTEAAERAGEWVWPLPLPDAYEKMLESNIADVKNIGGAYGGALTAGLFLRGFVKQGQPWIHVDLAGPSNSDGDDGEVSKGATGFGVRTLIEMVTSWND